MNLATARRMGSRRLRPSTRRLAAHAVATWNEPARRRLAFALAAAAAGAVAFARVTEDYLTNDPLARWDVSFARWLAGDRTTVGLDFFRFVTFFGSAVALVTVSAVVAVLLARRRRAVAAVLILLVLAGAEALNVILKLAFHRARPEVAFIHLDTYSYPSGHAMVSAAVYGALAYLAWGRVRTPRGRAVLVGGTILFVGLICFSRLYLGVHYLSDVLAGAAGGVFWLGVSIAALTLYEVRRRLT